MALIVDESSFPIVVVELRDQISSGDVDKLLADGTRWLSRQVPYATIYAAHKMSLPSVDSMKRLAAWMKKHKAELDQWHRCAVYVTDSAMLRGFLKALFRLQPLKAKQHATIDLDEAFEFAQKVLTAEQQA